MKNLTDYCRGDDKMNNVNDKLIRDRDRFGRTRTRCFKAHFEKFISDWITIHCGDRSICVLCIFISNKSISFAHS